MNEESEEDMAFFLLANPYHIKKEKLKMKKF